jgi:hypothetical protein
MGLGGYQILFYELLKIVCIVKWLNLDVIITFKINPLKVKHHLNTLFIVRWS